MSKLDKIKFLKLTKSRGQHLCNKCGNKINKGEHYYSEKLHDKFLHSLHLKKFCSNCFLTSGEKLLDIN